ncbi:MAG: alanine:cation symporter family protein, partial [Eggerthellaceae bacterium]|nr:alanine:cation symporter family protein [Eggerthellaceae bacterium]
ALERGFEKKKWAKVVAVLFAAFAALASFGIGAAVQSNSVVGIIDEYTVVLPVWVIGLILAALVAVVIFGGIKTISQACEKIVPFMAIFYIVCCLVIIGINGQYLLPALKWIVVCAFDPVSMVGGGAGFAIMTALRYGAARGLFSNESGMGSAPLAAANSNSKNPARTGLIIMSGAFWDTVVICLITGLTLTTAILASPELTATYAATEAGLAAGFAKGLNLTVAAFNQIPVFGPIVLIGGMVLFSYTTMIGWAWYGNRVVTYLFGSKLNKVYNIVFILFIFLGAIGGSALLASTTWDFADIMNGLMVVPNVVALFALSKVIAKDTQHYIWDKNIDEVDNAPIPTVEK